MALETLNIDYIKDKDNKVVFPVTHSDAIVGGLSKKGYNINDTVYSNNWDNVINTGIYYSSASSSSTNRPQLISGTSTINVVYDFIEVVRIGSSAVQLAKITDGLNASHVVAYREFTSVTDTGAGSKGTWKSSYYTSSITGSAVLTNVTAADQTLKMSGITSYSDLDGRIVIMYQESNANAILPTRIRVNNLAYVPLYDLGGSPVAQNTFGKKRVPMLVSYSISDSCFYLVGGGSATDYIPMAGTTDADPVTGLICFGNNVGGIQGRMGDNDYYRIVGRSTASDSGYLEIATSDNANEPIYVRQYNGTSSGNKFETISRTLTLMDGLGNTKLAGHLYLPGVAGATYDSKSKIIFGDTTNQYACIRANLEGTIVFSNSVSDNALSMEYNTLDTYLSLNPVTAGALSLGTAERWWDNIRGVRLYGGSGTASHIVLGGGANKHTWIDNRDSTETSVRSNIWLNDNGIVSLPKGKLGLYTDAPGNDKAVMQYNTDEKAIEFIFA